MCCTCGVVCGSDTRVDYIKGKLSRTSSLNCCGSLCYAWLVGWKRKGEEEDGGEEEVEEGEEEEEEEKEEEKGEKEEEGGGGGGRRRK